MKIFSPYWVLCACFLVAGDPQPGDFEYFDLGFSDGEGYQTEIRAFNPSFSESVLITVEAGDAQGAPVDGLFPQNGGAFSVTLPPLSSISVPTLDNRAEPLHGAMRLNSDGPVVAWSRITYGAPDRPQKSDTQVFRSADTAVDVARFNDLAQAGAAPRFPSEAQHLNVPLHEVLVVRNTEAFTSTVEVSGRDALLGHQVSTVQVDVAPHGTRSLTAGEVFPDLTSGRASLEVRSLDGRTFSFIRREDDRTLMRANPAVPDSGALPYANLPFDGFEGYYSFNSPTPASMLVFGELSLTEPVTRVAFEADIDVTGTTRFLPAAPLAGDNEAMGVARYGGDLPVMGSFTFYGNGARTEIGLTTFEGRRAVAYLADHQQRGPAGSPDLMLIENPNAVDSRLLLLGINNHGALRDLFSLDVSPGQNVLQTNGLFSDETEMVLIEKFGDEVPLNLAFVIADNRNNQSVLDSIEIVEIEGRGSLGRFLEEVAAWQTRDTPCLTAPNRLLGLVDMINHDYTCPANR